VIADRPKTRVERPTRSLFARDRPPTGKVQGSANVALVVACLYGAWTALYLRRHGAVDLALVGRPDLARGHGASAGIDSYAPHAHAVGYDGQFALFIARDPLHAHHYLDDPVYRLDRILYPMLSRVLALGQPGAIPATLLLVNVLAVVAGTFCLALLLARRAVSPWFALLFGLTPALFIGVDRDLNEPLAYALVIGALLVVDTGHVKACAALLGLAGITRETTLVFALALLVSSLAGVGPVRRKASELALFGTIAFAPFVVLHGLLIGEYGRDAPGDPTLTLIPFQGLFGRLPWGPVEFEEIYAVVAPSLVALVLTLVLVRRITPGTVALTLNVVAFVVLLPKASYVEFVASGRIALGVVVAFVMCIPSIPVRYRALAVALPALLWLAPWDTLYGYALSA
jgi:hypothetical protein